MKKFTLSILLTFSLLVSFAQGFRPVLDTVSVFQGYGSLDSDYSEVIAATDSTLFLRVYTNKKVQAIVATTNGKKYQIIADSLTSNDYLYGFTTLNNKFYFILDRDTKNMRYLIESDGTTKGSSILLQNEDLEGIKTFKNDLLFKIERTNFKPTLVRFNPKTKAETNIGDLYFFGDYIDMCVMGDSTIYLLGAVETDARYLFSSNGTANSLKKIKAVNTGNEFNSFQSTYMTVAGNKVYFFWKPDGGIYTLWASDGTEKGTLSVSTALESPSFIDLRQIRAIMPVGNQLFFRGEDKTNGLELWISNGTKAGTKRLTDIAAGSSNSFTSNITPFNGRVYFVASDWNDQIYSFKPDGTDFIKENSTLNLEYVSDMKPFKKEVAILATKNGIKSLYTTTDMKTLNILGNGKSINANTFSMFDLHTTTNSIYLTANFNNQGYELWRYDAKFKVSASNVNPIENVSIYPNPGNDFFNIENKENQSLNVKVYSVHGQILNQFETNESLVNINTSDYTSGMYFVHVSNGVKKSIFKWSK
jgi:ELWxxDGT repeat protein